MNSFFVQIQYLMAVKISTFSEKEIDRKGSCKMLELKYST